MAKREAFIKLGENRTRRAIKSIELIGNLSNRHSYEFNKDDVETMFRALQRSVKAARRRFQEEPVAHAQSGSFTLQ